MDTVAFVIYALMKLKTLRVVLGLKQKELGNVLGVDQSMICRWERRGQDIDTPILQKLITSDFASSQDAEEEGHDGRTPAI